MEGNEKSDTETTKMRFPNQTDNEDFTDFMSQAKSYTMYKIGMCRHSCFPVCCLVCSFPFFQVLSFSD